MVDPLKELDKALGIVSDVDKLQKEPWNYEHNPKQEIIVNESPMLGAEELLGEDGLAEVEANIEADYKYQRQTFYTLVEKGSTAIDGILELAKEGEHPRGYEVAGNLIKQVAINHIKCLCPMIEVAFLISVIGLMIYAVLLLLPLRKNESDENRRTNNRG